MGSVFVFVVFAFLGLVKLGWELIAYCIRKAERGMGGRVVTNKTKTPLLPLDLLFGAFMNISLGILILSD